MDARVSKESKTLFSAQVIWWKVKKSKIVPQRINPFLLRDQLVILILVIIINIIDNKLGVSKDL